MKSFLVASAVAIGVAAFTATLPSIAYAQHNHYDGGYGWGWGGFAAGAAADAILGGMLASPYNYGYAYEPAQQMPWPTVRAGSNHMILVAASF